MRGLNKLYYLKIDIENIEEEIKSLPTVNSPSYSDMPHGTDINNPIEQLYLKKEKLTEKLNQKKEKYTDELLRIENILDTIEDIEIRTIARMRFIHFMKWEDIGNKIHLDRTNCSRKLKKYIKNMDI